ncbi:MAG: bifunctional chorismate mutase/prephenate dehydratase [Pyrinomonadaceae bacterium]
MDDQAVINPRAEIDAIDIEILRLLSRRASIALDVGAAKSIADASLCDPLRETEVLAHLTAANQGPFDSKAIENIFQRVIDESLLLQQKAFHRAKIEHELSTDSFGYLEPGARVGFLGDRGSFSETAALAILRENCRYVSFAKFEELFEAIGMGVADQIISPLENSLVGSIQPCYDLLANSTLCILAEIILPVTHFLVACPEATIDTIRSVESHPAALGQCERFFAGHPHVKRVAGDDTAGSIRRAVESGDPSRAAIGGRRAARIYGAKILREHIEDHSENFTRFALLAAKANEAYLGNKISLVVRLKNEPGALHNALRPFVRRNIDLTKIESRPIKGQPNMFNFYLDLQAPATESDLRGAMSDIREIAAEVRFLGRYPTITLDSETVDKLV